MTAGITEKEQKIIERILDKYRKDYAFFYYGSRVKGTYEKTSDLDILVKGKAEMPSAVLQGIKEEFDNSDLPYIVNFSDYYKLDGSFYKRIKSDLIPYNWQEVKLGDVCDVRDGTHDSPKQAENGKYLITSKHIKGGKIDLSSAYKISIKDFDAVNQRSKVDQWDILISMIGTVGEICLVSKEPDFAIKNVGLIKTHSKDLAKYLYYYLKSPKAQSDISSRLRGTTQQYLSLAEIRNFPVVLPPLDVQKKITGVLGALDDKIELNNKINQNLEAQAQALFKSWFIDFEPFGGKMPNDWIEKSLEQFCKIFTGRKNANEYIPNGINPFFTCAPEPLRIDSYIYDGPAIIIAGNGAYTGRTRFYKGKFDLYQRTYACTLLPDVKQDYIYLLYIIVKSLLQEKIMGGTHGSAIPYIVMNDISKFNFMYNENIFDQLSPILRQYVEKILINEKENTCLSELRDTLLPKLMNGEIDVDNVKID